MQTHRNVDDTPDPAFAIHLEHLADLVRLGKIGFVGDDLSTVALLLRWVRREGVPCDLCDAVERLGRGVVVVVYRDNFVPAGLL